VPQACETPSKEVDLGRPAVEERFVQGRRVEPQGGPGPGPHHVVKVIEAERLDLMKETRRRELSTAGTLRQSEKVEVPQRRQPSAGEELWLVKVDKLSTIIHCEVLESACHEGCDGAEGDLVEDENAELCSMCG